MTAFEPVSLGSRAQMWRVFFAVLSLALVLRTPAASQQAPLAPRLTPNALQLRAQSMTVSVPDVTEGETVSFTVLKKCQPGKAGIPVSPVSLYEWKQTASDQGIVKRLDFQELRRTGIEIPGGEILCIKARSERGGRPAGLAVFAIVDNPCSFLQSVLGSVLGGRCTLGLLQSLSDHRGARVTDVPPVFEVGRLPLSTASAEPSRVRGTLGATGVAWLDDRTLIVTIGDTPETVLEVQLSGLPPFEKPLDAGVYLFSADDGTVRALWTRPAGESREPAAPLAMPDGRIAFVLQARSLTDTNVAVSTSLHIFANGREEVGHTLPLPYRVHQMFTLGDSAIVALALGSSSDAPTFFQIFTDSREMQVLGDQPDLYKALHLSRDGSQAVIEFEDNSGQNGWDLVLVGPDGKLQRELMVRPEHDMMPAWRPDGGEMAFLAERSAPR